MIAWIIAGLAAALAIALAVRLRMERIRRRQESPTPRWPIPTIALDGLHPAFRTGPHGATLATEVAFVGRGPIVVPGGTSDTEAWILAVLAKGSQHMFEFGTCTGKTAYLCARNAPEGAKVTTLTLAPGQHVEYTRAGTDDETDTCYVIEESAFEEFLYTGTPYADRITQLYGDSNKLDETPWHDWADLVFVDGSHARSYVESDSQKARRIVKPGCLALDFRRQLRSEAAP